MKTARKLLALLLAVLMVFSTLMLIACGDEKEEKQEEQKQEETKKDEGTTDEGKTEEGGTTEEPVEQDEYTSEKEAEQAKLQSLFDTYDFTGTTVNLFLNHDWVITEEDYLNYNDGDVVEVAMYNRQKTVEDNLGIIFNAQEGIGQSAAASGLETDVQSNSGEYHIVDGHMKFSASAALSGSCLNLKRLSQLDLTEDYWNQSYTEKWSYKNLQYWTTGDITYSFLGIMVACFVNASYWTEYFDEDIYAMVENGEWTLEKAAQIVNDFGYTDEDGDGNRSNGDLYAWVAQNGWTISSLAYGAGYSLTTKSGNKYELNVTSPEKEVLFERLLALTDQKGFVRLTEDDEPLQNGLCLITHERLNRMSSYRQMEDDFYVIPLPKADAESNYQTPSYDGVPIVGSTAALSREMYDVVGAVLESMAILGKHDVTIAFYEQALQAKYARDEGSFRCLDIIRASGWCDWGFAWCCPLSDIDTWVGDALQAKVQSMSVAYAEKGAAYETKIKKLYSQLSTLSKEETEVK